MAAAGYDVNAGDTWASTSSRPPSAAETEPRARTCASSSAASSTRAAKGRRRAVSCSSSASATSRPTSRRTRRVIQEWLQDSAFWIDMNTYVSDWSQEVYADLRAYAAPGAPTEGRREALVEYLRHSDLLAAAGGGFSGTANAFFTNASSPLANAAWQWQSGFGWTLAPYDLMRHFVSAQVYAFATTACAPDDQTDHFGFAWAPRNASGMPASDFTAQTVRGARPARGGDPRLGDRHARRSGRGSLRAGGQNVWCGGDLDGAVLPTGWRTFRAWSPTTLAFMGIPAALAGGNCLAADRRPRAGRGRRDPPDRSGRRHAQLVLAHGLVRDERRWAVHSDPERPTPCRRLRDGAGLLPGHDGRHGNAHRGRRRRRHGHADDHGRRCQRRSPWPSTRRRRTSSRACR